MKQRKEQNYLNKNNYFEGEKGQVEDSCGNNSYLLAFPTFYSISMANVRGHREKDMEEEMFYCGGNNET